MKTAKTWLLGIGAMAALLAGCSQQTLNSAQHDVQNDATVVNRETRRAERKARPQVSKFRMGARVTAALQAADVQGVRVDAGTDGVTLVGRVGSQADKARAVRIAQDTLGPDKAVHSRIVVQTGP